MRWIIAIQRRSSIVTLSPKTFFSAMMVKFELRTSAGQCMRSIDAKQCAGHWTICRPKWSPKRTMMRVYVPKYYGININNILGWLLVGWCIVLWISGRQTAIRNKNATRNIPEDNESPIPFPVIYEPRRQGFDLKGFFNHSINFN